MAPVLSPPSPRRIPTARALRCLLAGVLTGAPTGTTRAAETCPGAPVPDAGGFVGQLTGTSLAGWHAELDWIATDWRGSPRTYAISFRRDPHLSCALDEPWPPRVVFTFEAETGAIVGEHGLDRVAIYDDGNVVPVLDRKLRGAVAAIQLDPVGQRGTASIVACVPGRKGGYVVGDVPLVRCD